MMRKLTRLFAAAALTCAVGAGAAATAAHSQETIEPPKENWNFTGPFGAFDLASVQRGFYVYLNVCSNCHSMHLLHYRDLAGIGLSPEQIKAVAATQQVPLGLDDQGQPIEGPATPASQFRSPFPNEKAARAALNGALPPDLSLIYNAREGHGDYIHALLNGFGPPPAGFTLQPGMNYNKYFPGHQIAMVQPLHDGQVTFADGAPNTIDAMSRDVVSFLAWAANPDMVERKQIGVRIVLFLALMTGLTYVVKRKVWADVDH
jgi:ubiquinol-cytochrome c reductase cytochrome c1 subunit